MRRFMLPVVAVVVSLAVAASIGVVSASAAGGNSANAKLCQKGAWVNLVRSDGTTFANEEACVSYAAQGGTPMAKPQGIVSISFTPTFDSNFCYVTVNLSYFTPDTQYMVNAVIDDSFSFGQSVTTDSSGSASVFVFSMYKFGGDWVDASVDSVSSGDQSPAC